MSTSIKTLWRFEEVVNAVKTDFRGAMRRVVFLVYVEDKNEQAELEIFQKKRAGAWMNIAQLTKAEIGDSTSLRALIEGRIALRDGGQGRDREDRLRV
ncbi:MAG: hypothetical protein UW86_C0005G0002 [Microgenomates group bacterium GW2011_GWA1_Microgenomates_45_10]|nr:MAG: hypothetical protein UW69_C0005G0002 [Microgenomates group bacterium GW2011_GWA2_44_7]KKT77592.1 MAG: hypothetical protein UW73_C0016G0002 [Microgenomates group bacterium GW2011_GWB1_44_8]KKT87261.1 MAG: hypothetical protein UW86_C0005G0002 [Microgenomates group bacterium GW2011_GWA1_Microgenomates_45_10]